MKAVTVERERYYDSVFLMLITREVKKLSGINDAVVALATPNNKESLTRIGFGLPELEGAGPNDLVIAIDAEDGETLSTALAQVNEMLTQKKATPHAERQERPRTLPDAVKLLPEANLVLISVPGAYAAREARVALRRNLHVMLFSDNVPIEEEIALKEEACKRGLLMMGPDCGTAIINGKPLGFTNAVRRGSIGLVGASGTGIQEITSLIHRYGGGISQAIGTGGRDLTEAVGGMMTQLGIEALGGDEETEVIVVVSKAPASEVANRVIAALETVGKPSIVHFIGGGRKAPSENVSFAASLAEVSRLACEEIGLSAAPTEELPDSEIARLAVEETADLAPEQRLLRGLFCGGTLCQEAWHVLSQGGQTVYSNVALRKELKVETEARDRHHVLWDLGDDVFTLGRPHPMIDPTPRDERVVAAAEDSAVAVILVDLVLGYGAHPNPAAGLAESVLRAKEIAAARGGALCVIASITGTNRDPQGYEQQKRKLQAAGVRVMGSNHEAARLALKVIETIGGAPGRGE